MITSKINVASIVADHMRSLRDGDSTKLSFRDAVWFFLVPICCGGLFYYMSWTISESVSNLSITVFSIIAGFLINLLVLLYTISFNSAKERTPKYTSVLEETLANIAYAIILSIVVVVLLLFCAAVPQDHLVIKRILSALIIAFSLHFLMTFLMILKRIYTLIEIKL